MGSVHSGKRTFSFLNMVAYLQIIHWDFNITNFLPLEEMCHRLHFSFCRQLSNLSSYHPESFCGTVLMNAVTTPVLGCSKVWMALARLFRWQLQQMRVQQEHGRGGCNYIMIPNRLHAFRSFQCCQLTCVSLGLVANEWKWFSGSPQSWGLYDAVRFTLWYLNARICVLCAFSTKRIVCFFFVCFVFYTNVPFWPQLIRTFTSKFFENLYWMS